METKISPSLQTPRELLNTDLTQDSQITTTILDHLSQMPKTTTSFSQCIETCRSAGGGPDICNIICAMFQQTLMK
jgi:hypothetical protein